MSQYNECELAWSEEDDIAPTDLKQIKKMDYWHTMCEPKINTLNKNTKEREELLFSGRMEQLVCPTINSDDVDMKIVPTRKSSRALNRSNDEKSGSGARRNKFVKQVGRASGRLQTHPEGMICSIEYDDGLQVDLCFAQNLISSHDDSSF